MENEKNNLLSSTTATIMLGTVLNGAYPLFDYVTKEKDIFAPVTVDKIHDLLSSINKDFNNYLTKLEKDE